MCLKLKRESLIQKKNLALKPFCNYSLCSVYIFPLFTLNYTNQPHHFQELCLFCFKVFPDNFMRREVQAFVVNCTFMEDGCQWKGEVRHLEVKYGNYKKVLKTVRIY